ncbi:fused MFS/spermidine synthase, partial [Halobacterium bonnevillei]
MSRLPRITRAETAVFLGGIASMGLELLAGRLVTPTFGNSIYVWGSIIGVFLTALSLGYWAGGRTADYAGPQALVSVLTAAAMLAGVVAVFGEPIVGATAALPVPSRYAAVPAIVALFGPLTFLVGFVSPYGAELSAAESTGAASGRVYALGTIGSILGSFGTTFVLIPAFDVVTIAAFYGGVLLA